MEAERELCTGIDQKESSVEPGIPTLHRQELGEP